MNPPAPSVWLHRFAWSAAALTILLPVATGAVVTTLKAGMIFQDWPSSNGYSMWAYPWLNAARDEFVEHGHRLSGTLIGFVSIFLMIAAWNLDRRKSVRFVATCVFLTVFTQGLLGGARVLLDEQVVALLHGDFAAVVFSLMAVLVLITSKGWESRMRLSSIEESQASSQGAWFLFAMLAAQYVMGGFLRHLRERSEFAWAWMVHPWFALAVLFAMLMFVMTVRTSESPYLRHCAVALLGLTVTQALIGLGTWYVKYGVPSWGVVAQHDSILQIFICSLHKVVGLLTLMTSVLAVFCCRAVKPLNGTRTDAVAIGTSVAGVAT